MLTHGLGKSPIVCVDAIRTLATIENAHHEHTIIETESL